MRASSKPGAPARRSNWLQDQISEEKREGQPPRVFESGETQIQRARDGKDFQHKDVNERSKGDSHER